MVWFFAAVALFVLFMAYRSWGSVPPDNLGVSGGRLQPCPASPNCVCSHDTDAEHQIATISFDGDGQREWNALLTTIQQAPEATVITESGTYIHAEFRTRLFRFVDDVELLLDRDAQCIQLRSASRTGHSDLGVNRRRMEQLRQAVSNLP